MTIIKPLGSSEEQIASWQKMGIKYDKRTIKQMIAAYHTPPGATEQSILKFESTLPAKLPEDYRKFLLMNMSVDFSIQQSLFLTSMKESPLK